MALHLVTGGAGFIGSHLVEALLRRGDSVRVLDDFSTGRRENLEGADGWRREGGGTLDVLEGDIRDAETCRRALDGAEVVFHQAARASVPRSIAEPVATEQVNVIGTLNILMAARQGGARRVVAASSSSVYGASAVLPKSEEMKCEPLSPYALSKLGAETYCLMFHALYGLEAVALRYFNVFGPRQDPASQYAAVIPRFLTALLERRRPVVYGTGEQTRDFTFVENVVQANLLAARVGKEACGRVFNIACGRRVSLLELLALLEKITRCAADPVHEPACPGDVPHSLASISQARAVLGYEPHVGFEEGLQRTAEHFRSKGRA